MRKLAPAVFMLVLFMILASPVVAQEKWEYKVVNVVGGLQKELVGLAMDQLNEFLGIETGSSENDKEQAILRLIEERMNELGEDGWELVMMSEGLTIFKRQKIERN